MPFRTPIPNSPTCTDIQDKLQSDIYVETPDFSEFKDPWENYCVQNDPIFHRKDDNNETEQYYSTTDRSSPINMLSDTFNSVKSVHQTQYESPPEHNREVFHGQQYNEYNSSPLHIQPHHKQEQSNQFIGESKQKHMFFHSENTSITKVQSDYWQNQQSIENYVPVHSIQNHHSDKHQQYHVDYQHSCNNNNKLLSEETKQYQHTYQHPCNDSHKLLPNEIKQHQHVNYQHSWSDNHTALSEETKQYQPANYQHTYQQLCNDSHKLLSEKAKQYHIYQQPCNDNHKLFPDETKHQHIDYQHSCQHSSNNSNKSFSEETKQHQHHEPCVNHQHSQHQMCDNANYHQATQHYEQNSQILNSNECTDFECKNQEPFNIKIDHEQVIETNIIHQNNFSIKQNSEQNENINITDERTNTLISTSPHPVSKPCTDIHNVASQSDLHVTEDSSNVSNCSHILL